MSFAPTLPELEAIAAAASSGSWGYRESGCCGRAVYKVTPQFTDSGAMGVEAARHIAAFDPPTALALLHRLQAAEERAMRAETRVRELEQAQGELIEHGVTYTTGYAQGWRDAMNQCHPPEAAR